MSSKAYARMIRRRAAGSRPIPLATRGSLSLYDYCDNDPFNVYDPDGRFGKGVSSGWTGSISSSSPNTGSFSAGMSVGAVFLGGISGLGQGVQNVSGYTSYQSHLTMFDGDRYSAANAAWNPAYMAMRGFTEAGAGMGMQPHNLGQSLSAGCKGNTQFQNGNLLGRRRHHD